MKLAIEYDIEQDGRHIAEIPALAGVHVYGKTKEEATRAAKVLALQVLAERIQFRDATDEQHALVDQLFVLGKACPSCGSEQTFFDIVQGEEGTYDYRCKPCGRTWEIKR